jgi:hypothetical protein
MSPATDENLRRGSLPYLEPGEEVVATLIASVRGHQQAMAGGIAGMFGGQRAAGARRLAEGAGIQLASFMGLVLTPSRLLTFDTAGRGVVRRPLDAFALSEVAAFTVKRMGLGAAVTATIRDVEVRLESRVGPSQAFAEQLRLLTAR